MARSLPSDEPFGSVVTDIPGGRIQEARIPASVKNPDRDQQKTVTVPREDSWTSRWRRALSSSRRPRQNRHIKPGNYSKKVGVEPPGTISISRKGAPIKDK